MSNADFSVRDGQSTDPDATTQAFRTAAGTQATESTLARPESILLDDAAGVLYIADTGNGVVHRVDVETGTMIVVAGGGEEAPTDGLQATAIALQRPVGLSLLAATPIEAGALYLVDVAAQQVLAINLGSGVVTVVADAADGLITPRGVVATRLGGETVVFIQDAGLLGSDGVPGTAPRLLAVVGAAPPVALRLDLGIGDHSGPPHPLRFFYDLAGRVEEGAFELVLAADVGIDLTPYAGFVEPAFDFECNCYDGADDEENTSNLGEIGDDDLLADGEDPNCLEPADVRVLRLSFDTGAAPDLHVDQVVTTVARLFQKFPIEEAMDDEDCGGGIPGLTDVDFQGIVAEAVGLDPFGRIFVCDGMESRVLFFQLDDADEIVAGGILAGVEGDAALPFDGDPPIFTRFDRPRGVTVDSLGNVYLADTVNNRIRRFWVGDFLGNP